MQQDWEECWGRILWSQVLCMPTLMLARKIMKECNFSPCNLLQIFLESHPRIAGGSMVYECIYIYIYIYIIVYHISWYLQLFGWCPVRWRWARKGELWCLAHAWLNGRWDWHQSVDSTSQLQILNSLLGKEWVPLWVLFESIASDPIFSQYLVMFVRLCPV